MNMDCNCVQKETLKKLNDDIQSLKQTQAKKMNRVENKLEWFENKFESFEKNVIDAVNTKFNQFVINNKSFNDDLKKDLKDYRKNFIKLTIWLVGITLVFWASAETYFKSNIGKTIDLKMEIISLQKDLEYTRTDNKKMLIANQDTTTTR